MTTKSEPDQQTRRRFLNAGGATLAAVGTAGLASTSAAAQTDSDSETKTESPPQGILANELTIEGEDQLTFFKAMAGSFMPSMSPTPKARVLADRMRNEFTANSEHWVDYGNWLISEYDEVEPLGTVTLGVDVVVSRFLNDDERVETTLKAEYDDEAGEYTDIGWWIETPDDPDFQAELKDKAARNAADELQEYRRKFIDEDGDDHQIPDSTYKEKMKGRYVPHIGLGENGENILELLVGGMN